MKILLLEFKRMLRGLSRSPAYAVVVVLTLGVTIGANTIMFALVDSILIRPLPYPESDRLVGVWHTAPGAGIEEFPQADGTYYVYRQWNHSFEEMGIYDTGTANLAGIDVPTEVASARMTPSMFSVLRVSPRLGRRFDEEEERPGAQPTVILSEELWKQRFAADPNVLGTTISVDGAQRTIVGVMPRSFRFPEPDIRLWMPLTVDPQGADTGNYKYVGIARLEEGSTMEGAAADISSLVPRLPELAPEPHMSLEQSQDIGMAALVRPLRDDVVGDISAALAVLLGSVAAILLVACANVANLFLIRAEGRHRELAVRIMLGAPRRSVLFTFLAESGFLALLSGALGLTLAAVGLQVVRWFQGNEIPRLDEVALDSRAVLFTLTVSLIAGLVFGLLPALRALPDLNAALRGGGGNLAGRRKHRARRALVVAQIALALIVLSGAALMLQSLQALIGIDPGFDSSNVLTIYLYPPTAQYASADAVVRMSDRVLEQVRRLPGVRAASMVHPLPLADGDQPNTHIIEEFPPEPGQLPPFHPIRRVHTDYFETMGIPVVAGRDFERADLESPHGAVIVSESLARRYWPDESALGKRLRPETTNPGDWHIIVGVVGNTRGDLLEEPPDQCVYYPLRSRATPEGREIRDLLGLTLVVRTSVPPTSLVNSIRSAVRSIDPNVSTARVKTLDEVVAAAMARTSFLTVLLLLAAVMATGLGAVGLYGAISYVVSGRTREFGVRMAMGADRRQINRLVLGQGFGMAFLGIGLGLYGTLIFTRYMEAILFGVSPVDPATLLVTSFLVLLIALLSSYLPAQRAARVDPLAALREE